MSARSAMSFVLKFASFRYDFAYKAGIGGKLELETNLGLFDTRDAICREVGSFAHGEVLRGPDGEELVVVGVRLDDGGTPQLWFQSLS